MGQKKDLAGLEKVVVIDYYTFEETRYYTNPRMVRTCDAYQVLNEDLNYDINSLVFDDIDDLKKLELEYCFDREIYTEKGMEMEEELKNKSLYGIIEFAKEKGLEVIGDIFKPGTLEVEEFIDAQVIYRDDIFVGPFGWKTFGPEDLIIVGGFEVESVTFYYLETIYEEFDGMQRYVPEKVVNIYSEDGELVGERAHLSGYQGEGFYYTEVYSEDSILSDYDKEEDYINS